MDFSEWIKSTKLSKKSAGSYAGAINGCLTEWAQQGGLTSKNIVQIVDVTEFETLVTGIHQLDDYKDRNVRGHGMYAAALKLYRQYLDEAKLGISVKTDEQSPHKEQLNAIEFEQNKSFDPKDQNDARQHVLREVVRRRGQPAFRRELISAYSGRCAITNCPVTSILEAAHITPYLGPDTNLVSNGLLLRADLHTLWDLALIAVEPTLRTVWVSPQVNDPAYQALFGARLREPVDLHQRPSILALKQQWELAMKLP